MSGFVVVMPGSLISFGPFDSASEAKHFADFVTAEIDPAEVRQLNSPAAELLRWRNMMTAERNSNAG